MEIIDDPVLMTVDEDGMVRIAGTRVTLDTVVACYQQGDSAEVIAASFPSLALADVYRIIAYYLHHREEVDRYIAENELEADELRRAHAREYGKQPTLAELEARRVESSR